MEGVRLVEVGGYNGLCADFQLQPQIKEEIRKMETTKHPHGKCCQSAATTGKGRWRTCGNWRVIGGVMWDSLCGAGKIQMQLQFSTVSKNLNKTKQIYRKKHSR